MGNHLAWEEKYRSVFRLDVYGYFRFYLPPSSCDTLNKSLHVSNCQSQFSSAAQSCPTLCDPMDCSMPGFPVYHQLPELAQTMSIELVIPSNHLILCCPLLLLPSVFPSIRVFSNESVLHINKTAS